MHAPRGECANMELWSHGSQHCGVFFSEGVDGEGRSLQPSTAGG